MTHSKTRKEDWRYKLVDLAEKYCHHDNRKFNSCLYYIFLPLIKKIEQSAHERGRQEAIKEIYNDIPNIVRPIPKNFPFVHTQGRNYAYMEIMKMIEKKYFNSKLKQN